MKKITSVLLTVVMLMSMLSVTASAASSGTYVGATAHVNYSRQIVTVAFTAALATTNGKITVEYDAGSLTYMDCTAAGTTSSVAQSAGTVTFGYATSTLDAIPTGGNVATLTLGIAPGADSSTEINVCVEEFNGITGLVEVFPLLVELQAPPVTPVFPTPGSGSTGSTTQPSQPVVTPTTGPVTTDDVTEEGTVVTETTAVIESTTEGGAASATVTPEIAEEIVDQAVRNDSDIVVIAPEMSGGVTGAEVTLPADLVADIADKTGADLRVETPVADVTISNEGLGDLAVAGGDVSVSAERDGSTVAVTISAGGRQVDHVSGGVTVSIPQPGSTPGTVAMLVRDDGSTEVIRMSIASSDGKSIIVPLDGSATVVIVEDNSVPLSDVPPTNWAAGAVAFVTSHELMKGTGDGVFEPGVSMTRGMLAVVLHNLANNASASGSMSFSDVKDGAWYADAVAWAATNQVITGYPDGRFGPGDPITREQLAVMLYRYAGSPAVSVNGLSFVDADKVSDYARQAIAWAVANGILNGKGNGVLDPQGTATRAEVAQMLLNFVSSMA